MLNLLLIIKKLTEFYNSYKQAIIVIAAVIGLYFLKSGIESYVLSKLQSKYSQKLEQLEKDLERKKRDREQNKEAINETEREITKLEIELTKQDIAIDTMSLSNKLILLSKYLRE